MAALDAAAAVKEQLESKLEAAIEREKRLRLALAAAGVLRLTRPGRRDAARGDAAAAAAARLQDLAPAAKVAVDGARAARAAALDDLRAAGRASRRPEERSTRELLAADFGRR